MLWWRGTVRKGSRMPIPSSMMTMKEVVDHLIDNGYAKTRRAALRMIEEEVNSGDLPIYGNRVLDDGALGPVERIPVKNARSG